MRPLWGFLSAIILAIVGLGFRYIYISTSDDQPVMDRAAHVSTMHLSNTHLSNTHLSKTETHPQSKTNEEPINFTVKAVSPQDQSAVLFFNHTREMKVVRNNDLLAANKLQVVQITRDSVVFKQLDTMAVYLLGVESLNDKSNVTKNNVTMLSTDPGLEPVSKLVAVPFK